MILAINGSPKPHGNLERMVEKVARDTGHDYEMVHLAKLKINPCLGCVKCAATFRCSIQSSGSGLRWNHSRLMHRDSQK